MVRLPIPGADDGTWGEILNEFLEIGHNPDGTHKTLPVAQGGTGSTTASGARAQLGAASASALTAHIDETEGAHEASAISFTATGSITAVTVQRAIEEVAAEAGSTITFSNDPPNDLAATASPGTSLELSRSDHVHSYDGLATDAELTDHASATTFVHGIASTANLETQEGAQTKANTARTNAEATAAAALSAHTSDASAAHAASAISFTPTGSISSSTVQAAIAELMADSDSTAAALSAHTSAADPHTQYLNTARHNALDHSTALNTAFLADLGDVDSTSPLDDQVLSWSGTAWTPVNIPSGVTDHGALTGLADDDHPQYLLKAGGTMTGTLILSGTPTGDLHAATKLYVDTGISSTASLINAHLTDTADAHDASAISFTPTGTLEATDVQAAIAELASEGAAAVSAALAAHESDTTDVHGIADTAELETQAGAQAKADAAQDAAEAALTLHATDTADAHDASAISFTPTGTLEATDVQAAIAELASEGAAAVSAALAAHESDTTDVHGIADTAELETQAGAQAKADAAQDAAEAALTLHATDTADAHDASAISFTPTGTLEATDVQAAIAELASEGAAAVSAALAAHESDTTDVHGIADTAELETQAGAQAKADAAQDAAEAALTLHATDTADAHDASAISFTPTGTLEATDVQAAIAELASEGAAAVSAALAAHESDTTDVHGIADTAELETQAGAQAKADAAQDAAEQATEDAITAHTEAADPHSQYLNTTRHDTLDHSAALTTAVLSDLGDVDAGTPGSGDVLKWDGDSWAAAADTAVSDHGALTGLSDDDHSQYLLTSGARTTTGIDLTAATGATDTLTLRVEDDINSRFIIKADGTLEWGDGTLTSDVLLFRASEGVLATDGAFQTGDLFVDGSILLSGSAPAIIIDNATSEFDMVFSTQADGDSGGRFQLTAGGILEWGDGEGSQDTNLFRGDANVLKSDDNFYSAASIRSFDGAVGQVELTTISGQAGIEFGTAADTNLYRSAANTLKTDDNLIITGSLTLSADPLEPLQASTKSYVDAIASGLGPKASVRAATTANITLSGAQTIDTVSLLAGDRVLVKDQTDGSENGIYEVAAGAWTRTIDANDNSKVISGIFCFVEEGETNGQVAYVLSSPNPIDVGTTELTFVRLSAVTDHSGLSGLNEDDHPQYMLRDDTGAAADDNALAVRVSDDTQARFVLNSDGSFEWGPGNDILDTTLYRSDVNKLSLSGDLDVEGSLSIGGSSLMIGGEEAATRNYVDAVASGLDPKASVRAASTSSLTLAGEQTVDGVLVTGGDRVLVKDQSDASQNGIYEVSSGAWFRTNDAGSGQVSPGMFMFVEEGTENANTGWVLVTDAPIALDTTDLEFEKFSATVIHSALEGLTNDDHPQYLLTSGERTTTGVILSGSSTSTDAFALKVAGDTQARFIANAGGMLEWGPGDGSLDVSLYRSAVNTLKTDDTLTAGPGSAGFAIRAAGYVQIDDKLYFDPSQDTNLYRSAANTLKTDDSLEVAGNLAVTGSLTVGGSAVDLTDIAYLDTAQTWNATQTFRAAAASGVPIIAKGLTSQTGDLQQWQSDTAILAAIDSSGKLVFGPSGSQDTNLYRSAANTLKTDDSLVVSGSSGISTVTGTFTQTASGNTGIAINVTGDTNTRLAAIASGELRWGSGAASYDTNLYRSAANTLKTDDTFIIETSLGVGGVTPTSLLHLQRLAGDTEQYFDTYSSNNGHSSRIMFRRSHQNTVGLTATTTDSYLGSIEGYGVNSSTPGFKKAAEIRFQQDGTTGASNVPGRISFFTSDGTTGATERIRIDKSGNLGIGVTTGLNSKITLAESATAAGGILFGTDTNLYRSAANTLKTDDSFIIGGDLTLTNAPTLDLHAATKAYVDSVATGLDPKASVRVATTGNITTSGTQTIDGVAVIAGDRVLVKDQSTASQNGIYIVAGGAWTRSTDADNSPSGEVTGGMFTFAEEGTTNGGTGWVLTTSNPITLGTTSLTFVRFSSTNDHGNLGGLTDDDHTQYLLTSGERTTAGVTLTASTASNKPLIIKGAASQTASFFEVQSSSGTIQFAVTNTGQILGNAGLSVGSTRVTPADGQFRMGSANPSLYWDINGGQGNFLMYPGGGTSNLYLRDGANARMIAEFGAAAAGSAVTKFNGQVLVSGEGAAQVTNIVKGFASQTANLTQWQNSAGSILTAIASDGKILFGPSGSQDTNLYRQAANVLATDDEFLVSGAATSSGAFRSWVNGDTVSRFYSFVDGKIEWGPGGSTARDTNLYRSAANTLKTDDSLEVAGNLAVTGSLTVGGSAIDLTGIAYLDVAQTFTAAQTISAAPATGLFVLNTTRSDSGTSNIEPVINVKRTSSGTTAAGFGAAIHFTLEDLGGNTDRTAAQIVGLWESGDSDYEGALAFYTRNGTSGAAETMRLTHKGYLGLGRTEPTARLEIAPQSVAVPEGTLAVTTIYTRGGASFPTDISNASITGNVHANVFNEPQLTASSSKTVPISSTVTIGGAPIAGTNVTITESHALRVAGGTSYFSGNVGLGINPTTSKLQFAAATTAAGGITFGTDTNLYRSAADTLKTDDQFHSILEIYSRSGTADQIILGRQSAGSPGIFFGSSSDTNLYRSAADTLKTDDTFAVGANTTITPTGVISTAQVKDIGGLLTISSGGISRMTFHATNGIGITDGQNIVLGTTTGTSIGTATSQKLGFFGATPLANKLALDNATQVQWGTDTNLYRSAADVLKTDDSVEIAGDIDVAGDAVIDGTLTVGGVEIGAAPEAAEDIAAFANEGTLSVKTGKGRFLMPFAATILGVSAAVATAPTGASIIVDVHKNETTIFTTQANRPTIVASANATASEVTNMDVTALSAGDYLTIDIDQVGATIAGADLTVFIRYQKV